MDSPDTAPRSALREAVFLQIFGLGSIAVLIATKPSLLDHPLVAAGLQGLFTAWVARMRQSPTWWQAIHLLFLPAVVVFHGLHLPPFLWLGGFLLLFLVYWRTDTSRVPLYLSNATTGEALARRLPMESGFVVDLGCGTGGLLRQLSSIRPDCQFIGVEHAPIPYLIARWTCRRLNNVHIRYGNFWNLNLGGCQLAYAFLSPVPMARLWDKARAEMAPGAWLVSNSFPVPGAVTEEEIAVADARGTRLYCYLPTGAASSLAE